MTGVPKDFGRCAKRKRLDEFFSRCADTPHRPRISEMDHRAKRPETRRERIKEAVKMLSRQVCQRERTIGRRMPGKRAPANPTTMILEVAILDIGKGNLC